MVNNQINVNAECQIGLQKYGPFCTTFEWVYFNFIGRDVRKHLHFEKGRVTLQVVT